MQTTKLFSYGLLNRIVNFGIFPNLASFLATTLLVNWTCNVAVAKMQKKTTSEIFFSERRKYVARLTV